MEEDPATGFYIFILLPPSLHVCTVAISDIEMAPLVIPTIPTTPSLAIPAPWSSDKCSSPLPPDHLDRRRATGRRRESTRRSQIWWGRHICSNPSRFFNQIGRKLTAVLPRLPASGGIVSQKVQQLLRIYTLVGWPFIKLPPFDS